jgi:hypothetical protein
MPRYDYLNLITGKTVELVRSIAERDAVPPHLKRQFVPPKAVVEKIMDPMDADVSSAKGIRDLERSHGAEFVSRETGFSERQLKAAWDFKSTYRN